MEHKNPNQSFVDLHVWQAARSLKIEIQTLVKSFPGREEFRLTDQLIRAVRSINGNISEGHGRFTFKDQLHFCIQARGSLSETHNHLIDAFDCSIITEDVLVRLKQQIDITGKLLNGYITFLRNNLQQQ